MYSNKVNYCYSFLLEKSWNKFIKQTKLESNNNPFILLEDLSRLIQTVCNFVLNACSSVDFPSTNVLLSYANPSLTLDFKCEQELHKFNPEITRGIRVRYVAIVFKLIDELKNRFPHNNSVLSKELTIENTL